MIIGKYYKRIGYAKEDPPLRAFSSSVTNAKYLAFDTLNTKKCLP